MIGLLGASDEKNKTKRKGDLYQARFSVQSGKRISPSSLIYCAKSVSFPSVPIKELLLLFSQPMEKVISEKYILPGKARLVEIRL